MTTNPCIILEVVHIQLSSKTLPLRVPWEFVQFVSFDTAAKAFPLQYPSFYV